MIASGRRASTTSTTWSASASWSTRSTRLLRRARHRSTRGGTRSRAGSRTTSRCRSSTCTSRCTPPSIGPSGKPVELQIRTCGHAPPGRVRRRGALEVQGRDGVGRDAEGRQGRLRRDGLAAAARSTGSARPRTRAEFLESLRFDLAAAEVVRVHPARRRDRAAAGCDPGGLRLRHPHRGRAPHASAPGSTAAWCALESTLDNGDVGRDLHLQGARTPARAGTGSASSESRGPATRSGSGSSKERREAAIEQGKDQIAKAMRKQGLAAGADRCRRQPAHPGPRRCTAPTSPRCTRPSARAGSAPSPWSRSWSGRSAASRRAGGPRRGHAADPAAPQPRTVRGTPGVVVKGAPDVWVRLSRCCTPVPGDEIIGFVTRATACPCTGSTA